MWKSFYVFFSFKFLFRINCLFQSQTNFFSKFLKKKTFEVSHTHSIQRWISIIYNNYICFHIIGFWIYGKQLARVANIIMNSNDACVLWLKVWLIVNQWIKASTISFLFQYKLIGNLGNRHQFGFATLNKYVNYITRSKNV